MIGRSALRAVWTTLLLATVFAAAAGPCADFLNALAQRESRMDPRARNQYGYVGLFQMGEAALIDAGYYRPDGTGRNDWTGTWTGVNGINSLEDFLSNPRAQGQAIATYHQRVWGYIRNLGLDRYVGSTVGGIQMTESGLVAAAHLVGTGNLATFLRSDGRVVPRDGNRTPITEYISRFGGYDNVTTASADCADFARGTPRAGVPAASPPPAVPGGPTSGGRPVADGPDSGLNTEEAYYASTGYSSDSVARTIKLATAAFLMLMAAWTVLGNWGLFAGGQLTFRRFLLDNQRLLVVVCVMLFVLS